jgi:hypothetical protein
MTEVVVALYKNARAAETAVADLMVAKVPTTSIVSDPAICAGLLDGCKLGEAPGTGVVAATVDERHASLVRGILDMQGPAVITEAALKTVRMSPDSARASILPR